MADEGRRKSRLLHGQISVRPPVATLALNEPYAPEIFDGEPQEEEMEPPPPP